MKNEGAQLGCLNKKLVETGQKKSKTCFLSPFCRSYKRGVFTQPVILSFLVSLGEHGGIADCKISVVGFVPWTLLLVEHL